MTDPRAGEESTDKCGKFAGSFHPRLGLSYACVLDKGHDGECQRGGTCFKHGPYVGQDCPEWPNCVAPSPELDEAIRKQPIPEERAGREATRPKPPNPVSVGKRSTTVAWPVMATVKYVEQAETYMNSLAAQLAAQPSVQRNEMWVSCKQELPAYGRAVWVVWNGVVQNMAYSRDVGEWRPACDDSDAAPDGTFSHWMYKIEPPKLAAERSGGER